MSDQPKQLVHRWFEEVWNQGREATIDELFADGGIATGLGESEATVHGPAGFKPFWRNLRQAFPDIHIRIDDTIVEGHKVAVRVTLTGTHLGDGIGVPPTGRSVKVSGIVIIQVASGKLVAGWNIWDQLGMLHQVGALPAANEDRFLAAR